MWLFDTLTGRLADHIRSGTKLYLSRIRFLVLDEADRLLEDDFGEDLGTIFAPGLLPATRQTLLFSATFSDPLRQLLNVSLKEPFAYFETAPYDTPVENTRPIALHLCMFYVLNNV